MKIKQSPEDFVVEEVLDLKFSSDGSFSYFRLKKRDFSTENAVLLISRKLGVNRKRINYCGAKDKVAVTSQYISVQQLPKGKRRNHDFDGIRMEYLGQGDTRLTLGSHEGNRFIIIAKDMPKDFVPPVPSGVLNLFGPQRFSTNNADIGKAILKGDFRKAVELVLENDGLFEDDVQDFLSKNPNNFVGALKKIPFKILTLFIHAYQSRLFNRIADRWQGDKVPLIGFNTEDDGLEELLEDEGLSTRDFIIRSFPELTSEGDIRDKYMTIRDFSSEKLSGSAWRFSFFLGKGSYATVLLDWIFKNGSGEREKS